MLQPRKPALRPCHHAPPASKPDASTTGPFAVRAADKHRIGIKQGRVGRGLRGVGDAYQDVHSKHRYTEHFISFDIG